MDFSSKDIFKNPLLYLIVFTIGISMRLFNLTDSLWLDEIWSMLMSGQEHSVIDIINACKTDTHPPLFDILLHYVLLIGDEDITGRIFALFIGLLGVLATYYYTLRISKSHLASFLSFSLISFSYFHIYYSNEGRFYTFLYLLSLAVIAHLYFFLKEKSIRQLVLFVFFSILLSYTHYYGVILLFGLALVVLFLWIIKEIENRTFIKFIIGGGLILLVYLPWLPYMFSGSGNESWMNQAGLGQFFEYLYNYSGKNPVEFLFVLTAVIISFKYWKSDRILYSLLYGSILLGFIVPLVISYLSIPMLHIRYTFIYFPSLILLVAVFWEKTQLLESKKKNYLFIVVFLSILVNFFFINDITTKGIHKEPWREIASDVAKFNYGINDKVYSELDFYLNYYLIKNDHKRAQTLSMHQDEDSFWLLRTPYDSQEQIIASHKLIRVIDYGNEFVLEYYELEIE